jgi:hypothetical protein
VEAHHSTIKAHHSAMERQYLLISLLRYRYHKKTLIQARYHNCPRRLKMTKLCEAVCM